MRHVDKISQTTENSLADLEASPFDQFGLVNRRVGS